MPEQLPDNLQDWLTRLERLHPTSIALGLERVRLVAGALGVQPGSARIIVVAGTNGKGSTVRCITELAAAAGWRCGCYMSPHLHDFRERALVQGQWVAVADWLLAFNAVERARGAVSLTYFEFTTLAVLWLFRRAALDLWVLEVGLGGRLDAVNIVDADVAVITTIGLDHMEWLGPDRESIAVEKAGIIRPCGCVVLGEPDPPDSLRQRILQLDADVWYYGRDFQVQASDTASPVVLEIQGRGCTVMQPLLDPKNIVVALAALWRLDQSVDWPGHLADVCATLRLPGRYEHCPQDKRIVLDVAHNPHAAVFLVERLRKEASTGRTWVVLAMLADKDRAGTLRELAAVADGFFFAGLSVPRGGSAEALAEQAALLTLPVCGVFADPLAALSACRAYAGSTDRIVVCGSFYTVAAVREALAMRETDSNG